MISKATFLRAAAAMEVCNDFRRPARSSGRSLVHMAMVTEGSCRGGRRRHFLPDCFREQGLTRLCDDPLAHFCRLQDSLAGGRV